MTLTILTLNLHSYQEFKVRGDTIAGRIEKHAPLFDRIATAIIDLDVDVVCLQEVAEDRAESLTTPYGQAPSNAARRINMQIANGSKYHLVQDWSHYAWNTWREGLAILSKHPIRNASSIPLIGLLNGFKASSFTRYGSHTRSRIVVASRPFPGYP